MNNYNMKDCEIVHVVKIEIMRKDIQEIIDLLNEKENLNLTIEEVLSNEDLLDYLTNIYEDNLIDVRDYYNYDGFSEVNDYR